MQCLSLSGPSLSLLWRDAEVGRTRRARARRISHVALQTEQHHHPHGFTCSHGTVLFFRHLMEVSRSYVCFSAAPHKPIASPHLQAAPWETVRLRPGVSEKKLLPSEVKGIFSSRSLHLSVSLYLCGPSCGSGVPPTKCPDRPPHWPALHHQPWSSLS